MPLAGTCRICGSGGNLPPPLFHPSREPSTSHVLRLLALAQQRHERRRIVERAGAKIADHSTVAASGLRGFQDGFFQFGRLFCDRRPSFCRP
jgi:hypothetical protein